MKNLLILILLAVVAYLLRTSGTAVPALATLTSDGATPEISVTVYSPYIAPTAHPRLI